MNSEKVKHNIDLLLDDAVKIIDGPFKDLEGKSGEVDEERGRLKCVAQCFMFGRETWWD